MPTNNTKQAAWIGIGSMMSFVFVMLSSMILSRYFNKEDYGTYKQVLYVYNTFVAVFTLGLPRAYSYFLPRVEIKEAKSIIHKISFLLLILGFLLSSLLFVFSDFIGEVMNNSDLPEALRLFAIVPMLMLPTMGLDGILATYKRAKTMAIYNVVTKCIMLCFVALPVLLFDLGYRDAIKGFVVATFISFVIAEIMIHVPFRHIIREKTSVSYRDIFSFSIPLLFASFWGIIQDSSDSFFVSRYFGKEIFAEFANGNTVIPFVGMVVGACATVLSPVFSKLGSESIDPQKDIMPIWINVFEKSAMLIYPMVLYTIFFANNIMIFLYGQKYEISSTYFIIRSIVYFFNVIAIGPLLINVGYVRTYSMVQMVASIMVVLLDYISILTIHSPYAISIVQLVCSATGTMYFLYVIANYFHVHYFKLFPFRMLSRIIGISILSLLLIRQITNFILLPNSYILVVSLCLYSIIFYLGSRTLGIDYINILRTLKK